MRTLFLSLSLTLALAACSGGKASKITSPESLIDRSSERVTFSLSSPSARQDVAEWLLKDLPSRVELDCAGADEACGSVAADLEQQKVTYQISTTGGQPKAVFIYDRFMARACNPKYRDNSFNPLNRNHAALGCSISSNMVQSVADVNQFTNPPLMGRPSAANAVQAIRKLQK